MIISSTQDIVYKYFYLFSQTGTFIAISFSSDSTTVLWSKKLLQKESQFLMEYIIPGVLLQVCKQQKLWNLIFYFHYSKDRVISM